MKTNWLLVVVLVMIAAVAVAGIFSPNVTKTITERIVGSSAGPTNYDHNFFLAGLTDGGAVVSTSTATATYTPTLKDWAGSPKLIKWEATGGAVTLALDATSTADIVPNVGDTAVIWINNASTTAAAGNTITFSAKDASVDLQKNEDVADLACAVYDFCKLTFIRKSTVQIAIIYDNTVIAD